MSPVEGWVYVLEVDGQKVHVLADHQLTDDERAQFVEHIRPLMQLGWKHAQKLPDERTRS